MTCANCATTVEGVRETNFEGVRETDVVATLPLWGVAVGGPAAVGV